MKILIAGSRLTAAVNWIAKIADPRTPSLAVVVIRAADETTVQARNWDIISSVEVVSAVAEPGTVAVSAQGLALIASQIKPTDDVTLTREGTKLVVTRGRARWTLPELDVDLLPSLPELGKHLGTVSGEVLKAGITAVAPALAPDVHSEGNEFTALTGIECTFGENLTLAATDRYHLATVDLEWKSSCESRAAVIPAPLAKLVAALPLAQVRLYDDGAMLSVVTDTHRVTGRLLAGDYVPWRNAVPDPAAATTTVTVNAAQLLAAVRAVAVFNVVDGSHRGDLVELRFGPEAIELIGHNIDFGKGRKGDGAADAVGVEGFVGDSVTVFCQHPYLVDILRAVGSEQAVLSMTAPKCPVLVSSTAGDYRGVLVPVARR